MMITDTIWICKKRNGTIVTNITGEPKTFECEPQVGALLAVYRDYSRKYTSSVQRLNSLKLAAQLCNDNAEETDVDRQINDMEMRQTIVDTLNKIQCFFSEFSFSPNFRFINTIVCLHGNYSAIRDYIMNYFMLTDNDYKTQICDKMCSSEWKDVCNTLATISTNKRINTRFKLYYGAQGTGKTTLAMQEANNNCIVCHSAMLPSDLMEDFAFDDGKAAFKPSQLYKAMTEGKKIVLDEINLLPFESLRFLQSILDGKESFVYKGQTVQIAEGFEIIGTMNLQVNGCIYALPEPLVDRAYELRKFDLNAAQLLGAII